MDLETNTGCDAHRAMAMCMRNMKKKQEARDVEIHEIYQKLDAMLERFFAEMNKLSETKISNRLFYWALAILFGFLSFNALTNITTMRDMAVAQVTIMKIEKTQGEIKQAVDEIRRESNNDRKILKNKEKAG